MKFTAPVWPSSFCIELYLSVSLYQRRRMTACCEKFVCYGRMVVGRRRSWILIERRHASAVPSFERLRFLKKHFMHFETILSRHTSFSVLDIAKLKIVGLNSNFSAIRKTGRKLDSHSYFKVIELEY